MKLKLYRWFEYKFEEWAYELESMATRFKWYSLDFEEKADRIDTDLHARIKQAMIDEGIKANDHQPT